MIGPNGDVMEGAIATGHIHNQADSDGITRHYQAKINGTLALSIKAVQLHYQKSSSYIFSDTPQQSIWLNWRGASHKAPRYSFSKVLSGEIPRETFTNKIIFVGFTGKGLDVMPTPYNRNIPTAGVYQHIVAANNLLAQNHLKRLAIPGGPLLILISAAFGYGLFYRCLTVQILGSLVVIVAWCGAVIFAFNYNYWLPFSVPLIAIGTTANLVKLTEHILRIKQVVLILENYFMGIRHPNSTKSPLRD